MESMEMWNFWMLAVLFLLVAVLAAISVIISVRHLRWQKQQRLQREEWDREQRHLQEVRKRQEHEEQERLKAQFRNSDWLLSAVDFICRRGKPAEDIEIWENQIIIGTGKENDICPLEQFGIGNPLTKREIYCANMALFDALCEREGRRYYLEDKGLHCEIIRIR